MYNAGVLEHIGRNSASETKIRSMQPCLPVLGRRLRTLPGTDQVVLACVGGRPEGRPDSEFEPQDRAEDEAGTGSDRMCPGLTIFDDERPQRPRRWPGDRMSSTMRKSLVHDLGVTVQGGCSPADGCGTGPPDWRP